MEKSVVRSSHSIKLRNKSINILLPGHFSYIHTGHRLLIQDIKSSFKKVSLTVAVLNTQNDISLLTLDEKLSTFNSISEIDNIIIIKTLPSLSDLQQWNIDLIATASKEKFSEFEQVLRFEKRVKIDSGEIIARILRKYDSHVENLLGVGYHRSVLGVSKMTELSVRCKQQLKVAKKALWRVTPGPDSLELAVEKCRKLIQEKSAAWSAKQEQVLRSWLNHSSTGVNILQRLLRDVWEAA